MSRRSQHRKVSAPSSAHTLAPPTRPLGSQCPNTAHPASNTSSLVPNTRSLVPARLVWLSTRHTVAPKTPSLVFNTTRLAPNMPRRRSQHDSSGSQHTLLVDTDTVHRVMARGLLVGVTCDMFLSTFGRDRDTEKNKIFFEERKIFGLACRGSDRPRGRVTRHRPF